MKKNSTPNVEDHLELLKQMEEVDTDAFFYTRLRARMEKENESAWVLPLKPLWVIGTLLVLLLVNGFLLTQERGEVKQSSDSTIQDFARSYDQTISSIY